MDLQGPQDNMGGPKAQGRQQPPPKPPHRNKGRVIWYPGSCPYTDWTPPLEIQSQGVAGLQEPEGELQPMQQMTTRDTLDRGYHIAGGLSPPNIEEQMPPTTKEAESPAADAHRGHAGYRGRHTCPYSDWPPPLEDKPQVGSGPQDSEGELKPVQQMASQGQAGHRGGHVRWPVPL
ncbi:uncharacterized protein LOC132535535 isoform X2 [Erinaceus europaeus]|uniref:Uncharacterized protein LOC132535535 isoform X2 n=1 Tax=Erinaceus europaeus TaxID=9365 RepID=A0ABM3WM88_ERIEU|nr:uncharacterized protein LOC132535535 isoform X2 [Erinaceus europaeus]